MLFARTIEEENFSIFRLFLEHSINGVSAYKAEVTLVVLEAKELAEGKKDLCSINRESFIFIIFLKKYGRDLLESIDPNNIKIEEYRQMLEIFNKKYHVVL